MRLLHRWWRRVWEYQRMWPTEIVRDGSVSFPADPVSVAPSAPTEIPAAAIGEPREQILSRAITDDLRIGIDIGVHRRPCLCGHARIDHVDPEGQWFDGMCQVLGCLCTDAGYIASRTP